MEGSDLGGSGCFALLVSAVDGVMVLSSLACSLGVVIMVMSA